MSPYTDLALFLPSPTPALPTMPLICLSQGLCVSPSLTPLALLFQVPLPSAIFPLKNAAVCGGGFEDWSISWCDCLPLIFKGFLPGLPLSSSASAWNQSPHTLPFLGCMVAMEPGYGGRAESLGKV